MTPSPNYKPPGSKAIERRQDEPDALRLLIAQRRLYSRAKRWLGARWIGMLIIGIAAPVVSILWPSLAVPSSAVAGVWLFLGRTFLLNRQTTITAQAAAVQEQFDLLVFGMPEMTQRPTLPTLEDIAAIAGPDGQLRQAAVEEELLGWYPIDETLPGVNTVAIAQRANASYTNRLLRTTAIVWACAIGVWIVALVVTSLAVGLELPEFLLGIVFPLLPSFLDVVQYVTNVRRSASEKGALASTIEEGLTGSDPVRPEDLLVWQSQLFDLRRSAPEVPDFIYKLTRLKNEQAMETAARQLGDRTRRRKP